jgi:phosphate transport system substrate-binding protein
VAACALIVSACTRRPEPEAKAAIGTPVRVDGSSTVYLVSKAVAEEVGRQGVVATVKESGTTGGFRKFCAGETDVSGASRPIEQSEMDACRKAGIDFIELPIGYDGLAVAVNEHNTWVDHLTVDELKKIWSPEAQGLVMSWRNVRPSFPNRPLHLFGPGHDSGTFDYFTQAIVGKQRASRSDYTSSEDDTVLVRGVKDDENALSYFGYAYVARNPGLRAIPVDDGIKTNGDGPIAPSRATVEGGSYQPLSRPMFIYVSTAALQRPEVESFISFYLQVAHELSSEVGYFPLRSHADELAKERFKTRKSGSMFAGGTPAIGMTMEKLLEAQTLRPGDGPGSAH